MLSFSREYRLKNKNDFQTVFVKPQKVVQNALLALYTPNDLSRPRLGIILAKKHVKLAVNRNRVKRLLRESFRQHQIMLKGLDIVVLLRSKWSPSEDNARLQKDIAQLWKKLAHSQSIASCS